MTLTPEQTMALCRKGAEGLMIPEGIDGTALLWALAGNESSFGVNAVPRHEAAYCRGGKYGKAPLLAEHRKTWGCWACCSYGPWQITYLNALTYAGGGEMTPICLESKDGLVALRATIGFLNGYVFGAQKARTIEQIADTYNSGNWRDAPTPDVQRYISEIHRQYRIILSQADARAQT
jgi:hypothetical protein